MRKGKNMRFGPHTALVEDHLAWIDRGELLCFGTPPSGPFLLVPSFEEALAIAQEGIPDGVDWTNLRENADALLYEVGLLDTPAWFPHKAGIDSLFSEVGNRVVAMLPEQYEDILDDAIADLHTCLLCVAVHGHLDPFHERLWGGYAFGGWPCGCTGQGPELADYEQALEGNQFYLFWTPSP